jgi:hypothetical protein
MIGPIMGTNRIRNHAPEYPALVMIFTTATMLRTVYRSRTTSKTIRTIRPELDDDDIALPLAEFRAS